MKLRFIAILFVYAILMSLFIAAADASPANNGIWMQATYSGNQAWAYYPYDPAHPFTGGSYSTINNGTAFFTVKPGTTIFRKYIVLNNEPYNDSVNYVITGLPSSWAYSYTKNDPIVISYVYNPSVGLGAQLSHQGFGSMVVAVPSNAAPGAYTYNITATSGTGYTSSLTDKIIVGTGGTSTPTPSPPVFTPTPTPSINPTPVPGSNLLYDPGFEQGNVADSHWFGTNTSNYMKRNVQVTSAMAHNGTYSLHNLLDSRYARTGQLVPYGGNGFEASYWFYINKTWPAVGSVWLNVVDYSARGWDDESHYRGVGMDNRTWPGKDYFATNLQSSIRPFVSNGSYVSVTANGWYNGIIRYSGGVMTFTILDSNGNVIGQSSRSDPGFTPIAIIATAGCPGFYIDDLSYKTW